MRMQLTPAVDACSPWESSFEGQMGQQPPISGQFGEPNMASWLLGLFVLTFETPLERGR